MIDAPVEPPTLSQPTVPWAWLGPYPAWQWLVAGMVMFVVSVPLATGVLLSAGTGSPPTWAGVLALLGISFWGFVLLVAPLLQGAGVGVFVALLLWPLFVMTAALVLDRVGRKKLAGVLAFATSVFFLPSGLLNVFAGLAFFREAKEEVSGPTA